MAGDWIKIEENTPDKPEVAEIASQTGLDVDAVLGKLIRVWVWASRNCHGDGVTLVTAMSLIDRAACHAGFAQGMVEAGWLLIDGKQLTFPKFDEHNSTSAKDRGQAYLRKQRERALKSAKKAEQEAENDLGLNLNTDNQSRRCHGQSVTSVTRVSRSERDKNETKETETETDNIKTPHPAREAEIFSGQDPGSVIIPPCSLSEATHYAATIGMADDVAELWWEKRDAEDWRPRNGELPLTTRSWKVELKTYHFNKTRIENERRRNQRNGAQAVGKAGANPRNSHLPDGEEERIRQVSEMEDIRDDLRFCTECPEIISKFNRERVYGRREYQHAIEWIKARNTSKGVWNGVYDRLAKSKIIDEQSGRWIADNSQPG
jgi:hypothetical protein